MLNSLLLTIFGDPSEKKLKNSFKELEKIKSFEAVYKSEITTIEQIQAKTHEFQSRFSGLNYDDPEDFATMKATLESTKHEAFALHRRACEIIYGQTFTLNTQDVLVWNMIPYDVQLVGALTLHDGNIAEMRT
jgi:preprotein translocase subunit SecA